MAEAGLIKGLAAIQAAVDKQNQDFGDGSKAEWLKLKDGESKKIWFLQEFDEDSKNYSPKAGTILVAVEHSSPENYMKKALCTIETGACLGCEMNKAKPKTGWNQKMRLYANVLVESPEGPKVAILSQGIGPKSITPTLAEIAASYEGVTQTQFLIKRSGEKMNTSYTIFPLPGGTPPKPDDYELYDLSKVATRTIDYEDQAEFYEVDTSEPVTESAEDFTW